MSEGGYCEIEDLLIGNIPIPDNVDAEKYVTAAAEEIDAKIGLLYVTPIRIKEQDFNKYRATIVILRSINARLASGRLICALATPYEGNLPHAYGMSLIKEALDDLRQVTDRIIILEGATPNTNEPQEYTASRAFVAQRDPVSAVDKFYQLLDPRTNANTDGAFLTGWAGLL